MAYFDDWIGRETHRSDMVTGAALDRYRATIGQSDPAHSRLAPPGFHWCLCTPDETMETLGEDGHPRLGGFMPPVPLPRRMWAASDIEFLRPIRVGEKIEKTSTISAIREKRGRSGLLIFVDITHLVSTGTVLAVREKQTIVFREAASSCSYAGGSTSASPFPIIRSLTPTTLTLFRYSALTFNAHRIHYDLAYTQEIEKYPSLVVQAPLVASYLLNLSAEQLDKEVLKRFRFRAVSPAFVSQELHLLAKRVGDHLALEARVAGGGIIMEAEAE